VLPLQTNKTPSHGLDSQPQMRGFVIQSDGGCPPAKAYGGRVAGVGELAVSGDVSAGLRDLDAKSLRGVPQASVVAVQTPEILAQAYDGCQMQRVE
jgi:hypothetical protein